MVVASSRWVDDPRGDVLVAAAAPLFRSAVTIWISPGRTVRSHGGLFATPSDRSQAVEPTVGGRLVAVEGARQRDIMRSQFWGR